MHVSLKLSFKSKNVNRESRPSTLTQMKGLSLFLGLNGNRKTFFRYIYISTVIPPGIGQIMKTCDSFSRIRLVPKIIRHLPLNQK